MRRPSHTRVSPGQEAPARRRLSSFLAAATAVLVAAGGLAGALAVIAQAAPAAAAGTKLPANWYESAPYYLTLDSGEPALPQVMSTTGEKAFVMAFILASGSSCSAAWDGTDPVSSDTSVAAVIKAVRSSGGDVAASAGGYNGTKLGQVCGSASATAAAYQKVIKRYGLHAFDFDLEEPEIENSAAIARELGAAKILQGEDPGLFVSVTIPSTTSGANYFGGLLLDEAKSLGFTPDDFSIMPFDGGFSGGASQVTALRDFHTQLMAAFGWSSADAYAHEGFSGMNGRSDTAEDFYPSDFQTVLSFAEQNGMSRFTFWSVNRDRPCNPPSGGTSSECSSITQVPWAFTAYSVAFAKNAPVTPPPSPSPSPTPTGGGGGCTAPPWSSAATYTSGDQVSYNGSQWTASQWNYDEVPGGSSGAWTSDGPC